MTWTLLAELAVQGGILLFCAFVQSAVGFAFSLFSNSLLLLAGLALPETVMLSFLGSALQRSLMISRMRGHVAWREVVPLSLICLITLPLGIGILKVFSQQSATFAKMAMGALILAVLVLQFAWRVKPREKLRFGWGVLAAACSGLLTGLANVGGPPLLLWIHAHDWPTQKTRATAPAITLVLVPVQFVLMLTAFGGGILPHAAQFAVMVPAILLGLHVGLAAGNRLSKPRLRAIAMGLLFVICLMCIAEPLL